MTDESASSEKSKKVKPWHWGLAIGFLMAIVYPFNTWLLKQLGLVPFGSATNTWFLANR